MKKLLFALIMFFSTVTVVDAQPDAIYQPWTKMLKKYVDKKGMVNYKQWKKEEKQLDQYLQVLSAFYPSSSASKSESLAYWINAYNAFTVKLILQHYPVKSIRDIHEGEYIPGKQTPWTMRFIQLKQTRFTLDSIEHSIIRKQYDEPRIHFAIVCASISCPRLLSEAFTGKKLEQQLTLQAKSFFGDTSRNKIAGDRVQLNKIMQWYKADFTKGGRNIIDFINLYAPKKIAADAAIEYLEYNWNLNEQKN